MSDYINQTKRMYDGGWQLGTKVLTDIALQLVQKVYSIQRYHLHRATGVLILYSNSQLSMSVQTQPNAAASEAAHSSALLPLGDLWMERRDWLPTRRHLEDTRRVAMQLGGKKCTGSESERGQTVIESKKRLDFCPRKLMGVLTFISGAVVSGPCE